MSTLHPVRKLHVHLGDLLGKEGSTRPGADVQELMPYDSIAMMVAVVRTRCRTCCACAVVEVGVSGSSCDRIYLLSWFVSISNICLWLFSKQVEDTHFPDNIESPDNADHFEYCRTGEVAGHGQTEVC